MVGNNRCSSRSIIVVAVVKSGYQYSKRCSSSNSSGTVAADVVVILAESLWQMLSWLISAVGNPTNLQEPSCCSNTHWDLQSRNKTPKHKNTCIWTHKLKEQRQTLLVCYCAETFRVHIVQNNTGEWQKHTQMQHTLTEPPYLKWRKTLLQFNSRWSTCREQQHRPEFSCSTLWSCLLESIHQVNFQKCSHHGCYVTGILRWAIWLVRAFLQCRWLA